MKGPTSRGLFTAFAMVFVTLLATAAVGYLNVRRLYDHDRLVVKGGGRTAMERLRESIGSLERDELRLLNQRVNEANISFWTATISCLIMAVIGLGLIALGYRWSYRDVQAREARAAELKNLNEHLEQRVRERTAALSTANIALQEEIAERQRAENEARLIADELARSNHELAQFAAVASHDLQEPLRKIQAFGDRLYGQVHDELSAKGRDYLNRILASAARMRQLIDGLLEYSRVSGGPPPLTRVDLGQVAHDVVTDLESQIQQTHAEIEVGELPTIGADAVQMQQLLQNLISNALKFHSPDHAPHICVTGCVVADTSSNGDSASGLKCELTVEDNGVGFDPEYSDEIFEMFHRLHRRNEFEGTGMGLAICKKICERHHGSIAATSKPGQGSRFVVRLPVTPPSLAATA